MAGRGLFSMIIILFFNVCLFVFFTFISRRRNCQSLHALLNMNQLSSPPLHAHLPPRTQMSGRLAGKTAVITAAAQGIGRATALVRCNQPTAAYMPSHLTGIRQGGRTRHCH